MQQAFPFQPTSATVSVAVGATTTALTLPTIPQEGCSARIVTVGTQMIQVSLSGAATTSSTPFLANSSEVISIPPGSTFQAIAASTGSTVYVTFGIGM